MEKSSMNKISIMNSILINFDDIWSTQSKKGTKDAEKNTNNLKLGLNMKTKI